MSKITITLDIDDEYADPLHEMGVTNEGSELILRLLSSIGFDIEVERAT